VPKKVAVGAVLTAVLALAALPGLVGSRTPSPDQQVPAAAFSSIVIDASEGGSPQAIGPIDAAHRSDGYITADATLVEPAADQVPPAPRPAVRQPSSSSASEWKPPRYSISGIATWYDNGTTAMRLPRGTVVVVCGAGGCVQRTVTDYGPAGRSSPRIVDLMPGDFVTVCGCGLGAGTQRVTVKVY
jgi:hypothetical protein